MLTNRAKKETSCYDLENQHHHSPRAAAFFDLDKTILAGDSQELEAMLLLKKQQAESFAVLYVLRLLRVAISDVLVKWNFMDAEQSNRYYLNSYKGMSLKSLKENAKSLYDSTFGQLIYPEMITLIEKHKQKGHYVILVSASTEHLVKPFVTHNDVLFDFWKATSLETDANGVCTGLPERQIMIGQNKATVVKAFLTEHNIKPEDSYSYSDHHSDIPFLECVGKPTAINPTETLERIAEKRSWPIMHISLLPSQMAGKALKKRRTLTLRKMMLFFTILYLSIQFLLLVFPVFSVQVLYLVLSTMRILWDIIPFRLAACISLWPVGKKSKVWLSVFIFLMCGLHLVRPHEVSISPEVLQTHKGVTFPYSVVISDKKRLPSFFRNVADTGLSPQNVHHQDAVYKNQSKKSGIWESYRQAFRQAVNANNASITLTFEDDVELYEGWTYALFTGMDAIETNQCDTFLLGGFNLVEMFPVNGVDGVYQGLGACTEAALFSRAAMQVIIDLDDMSQPLEIDNWMAHHLRTCYYKWPTTGQKSLPSPNPDSILTWGEYIYMSIRFVIPFSKFQVIVLTTGRMMSSLFGKHKVIRAVQSFLP